MIEKLILKLIEREYRVRLDFTINIVLKDSTQRSLGSFISEIELIFGKIILESGLSVSEFITNWVNHQEQLINTKLINKYKKIVSEEKKLSVMLEELNLLANEEITTNYIKLHITKIYYGEFIKPNLTKWFGSTEKTDFHELIEEFNKNFDVNFADFTILIYKDFVKNYREKFVIPTIKHFINDFFTEDNYNLDSGLVDLELEKILPLVHSTQHEFVKQEINNFYFINYVEAKVKDLLNQFVVTSGKSGWLVTWIGHGKMTDVRFREMFKKENSFVFNAINGLYEEWFEEKIIIASEKEMGVN